MKVKTFSSVFTSTCSKNDSSRNITFYPKTLHNTSLWFKESKHRLVFDQISTTKIVVLDLKLLLKPKCFSSESEYKNLKKTGFALRFVDFGDRFRSKTTFFVLFKVWKRQRFCKALHKLVKRILGSVCTCITVFFCLLFSFWTSITNVLTTLFSVESVKKLQCV